MIAKETTYYFEIHTKINFLDGTLTFVSYFKTKIMKFRNLFYFLYHICLQMPFLCKVIDADVSIYVRWFYHVSTDLTAGGV